MQVNLDGAGAAGGFSNSVAGVSGGDQDQFLKLLVAQLANQDPLSPADGAEFVAQLAQFTSVEQLVGLNGQVENLALSQVASSNANVAGLIGKEVIARGAPIELGEGGGADFEVELPYAADELKVTISDSDGNVVAVLEPGGSPAGVKAMQWDGRRSDGTRAPAGEYTVSVSATDGEGNPLPAVNRARARVSGVSYAGGVAVLRVGGQDVPLGDVVEVHEAAAPKSAASHSSNAQLALKTPSVTAAQ